MSDNSTPIVANGVSAPNFDTLEAALTTEAPKVETAPKTEQTTTKVPEVVEETETTKEVKASKEEVTSETKTKTDEVATEEEPEAKTFKFKTVKGREVDIPVDSVVTKKIDGKDVEVSIKQALDQYSGQVAYDRKFSELDQERKSFDKDVEKIEQDLTSILEPAYKKQDAAGSILELARVAKLDPAPLYKAFQDAVVGDLDKFMVMDEHERRAHLLEKENQFLKRSQKSSEDREQAKQTETELEREITKLKETFKVDDEWIGKAEAHIKAKPEAFKEWLKDGQGASKQNLIQLADVMRRWDLAERALTMVDPELAKDEDVLEFAAEKLRDARNISVEEAAQLAAKFFKREIKKEPSVPSSLGEKLKKAQTIDDSAARTSSTDKSSKKKSDDEDATPWSWDQV